VFAQSRARSRDRRGAERGGPRTTHLKIKTARDPVVHDVDRVGDSASAVGPDVSLRVDANQEGGGIARRRFQAIGTSSHTHLGFLEQPWPRLERRRLARVARAVDGCR